MLSKRRRHFGLRRRHYELNQTWPPVQMSIENRRVFRRALVRNTYGPYSRSDWTSGRVLQFLTTVPSPASIDAVQVERCRLYCDAPRRPPKPRSAILNQQRVPAALFRVGERSASVPARREVSTPSSRPRARDCASNARRPSLTARFWRSGVGLRSSRPHMDRSGLPWPAATPLCSLLGWRWSPWSDCSPVAARGAPGQG